ncbi:DUF6056 family protein [Hymenobacter lapidiphilus]|uniref:Uncharacterized protein n=1 Tax=Hymenobacter lapidiphilus TaxID=2608003 RepID=A0A7Y7PRR6_9BACT|nr:DUF6056 family protein [Hymenobacter lapidiphilus]NVO32644.1 hypothetical protein [Hymenobacter lapidiphilus]
MRTQKALAALLVFLTILPFVVLCFYSHPAFDDFSDAVQRRNAGFWTIQQDLYQHLTGRLFTSVVLTEASPLVYDRGLANYWLAPLGTLVLLGSSLYALVAAVVKQAWEGGAKLLATGVLLALWLVQNPSVAESVYWFNGLAVYTIPCALLVFWLAVVVQWWPAEARHRTVWLVLNLILGTCVLWSNEIIALPLLAVIVGLCGWEWWRRRPRRKKRRWQLLGLLSWFCGALAFSLLAPGNMARAAIIDIAVPWHKVLLGPPVAMSYLLLNWLSSGVLLFGSVLAVPALVRLVGGVKQAPALVLLVALRPKQLLVAGITLLLILPVSAMPSYWATGGLMPPRARAALYLLFLLSWFTVLLATVVVTRSSAWQRRLTTAGSWPRPVAALLWAGLLLNLATDHNLRVTRRDVGRASNNAALAYCDLFSGKASRYDALLLARYDKLRTSKKQRVEVAALPPNARPASLFYYDITTDSTFGVNRDYGAFFHKQTVWTGKGGMGHPPKTYQPPAEDEE